ncbi:MAG TPA: nuclear transport factor 2 family protein [Acidimicrobiia bacterium]|nr:nuclear transport factor 2 family protein [Acidimicrobiia bacterium]
MASDLSAVMQQDHEALGSFVKGDPEPKKKLYSRRDDATLANPLGPPARGWRQIEQTLEHASSILHDGELLGFDRISEGASGDLAYIVEIERYRVRAGDAEQVGPSTLRVTTVFRREDGEWKIAHRHADTIVTSQPAETVMDH